MDLNINQNVMLAFALTAFAGLSTGIGSAIAFFSNKTNKSFLAISLGFSAGVMIYVSFVEIFQKSYESLAAVHGDKIGMWYTMAAFFGGILLILIIDKLVPSYENPHEPKTDIKEMEAKKAAEKLKRMGLLTALAIAIHNFPEGLATFTAAMTDPALGISIAV
ncbi:MAG: ZIP family metal transporter, partial [Bacteroidota bacterium]